MYSRVYRSFEVLPGTRARPLVGPSCLRLASLRTALAVLTFGLGSLLLFERHESLFLYPPFAALAVGPLTLVESSTARPSAVNAALRTGLAALLSTTVGVLAWAQSVLTWSAWFSLGAEWGLSQLATQSEGAGDLVKWGFGVHLALSYFPFVVPLAVLTWCRLRDYAFLPQIMIGLVASGFPQIASALLLGNVLASYFVAWESPLAALGLPLVYVAADWLDERWVLWRSSE